ncbi:unnamed protein product [Rangifer tarandus platyrhynchus]|uniref:Collagen alpha-1(I) chain-like n=1 Tax=Rangifer tarandus platyrhynchus TaxID=3082113 RepID=A0ABN8YEI2_RANTA|nr:unnamed protein product [Rangifer tarandus platyrhynchus]
MRLADHPAPCSAEGPRGDGPSPGPEGPAGRDPCLGAPALLISSGHREGPSEIEPHGSALQGPGLGAAVDSPCLPPREALGSPQGAGTRHWRRLGKLRAGSLAAVSPPDSEPEDSIPGPAFGQRAGRTPDGGEAKGIHGEGAGAQSGRSPRMGAGLRGEVAGRPGAWGRGEERRTTEPSRTGRLCAEGRPLEACPASRPPAALAVVSSKWALLGGLWDPDDAGTQQRAAWLPLPPLVGVTGLLPRPQTYELGASSYSPG